MGGQYPRGKATGSGLEQHDPGPTGQACPMADRLFVAIWPPPDAVAHITAALAAERPDAPDLRWQPPDRWHITLAFLGEADAERSHRRLARTRLVPVGRLRIAGSGAFGPIVWLGVEHGRGLADLAAGLQATLRVPDRRFRAHVTVARARGRSGAPTARQAAEVLSGYRGPAWTPHEVTLVRSVGGPAPRYEVLGSRHLPMVPPQGWPPDAPR